MWHWHCDWQARAFELNGYALVQPLQPRAHMGATGTRILAGSIVQLEVHVQASCTELGTSSANDTGVTLAGPVAVAARTAEAAAVGVAVAAKHTGERDSAREAVHALTLWCQESPAASTQPGAGSRHGAPESELSTGALTKPTPWTTILIADHRATQPLPARAVGRQAQWQGPWHVIVYVRSSQDNGSRARIVSSMAAQVGTSSSSLRAL